jgi:hypothetical protein
MFLNTALRAAEAGEELTQGLLSFSQKQALSASSLPSITYEHSLSRESL